MAKASDNPFPYVRLVPAAAPSSPPASSEYVYLDSGDSNKMKRKNSAGTVTTIEGGGSTPGAWTSFTPTLGGITLGNGTLACAYRQDGKDVMVRIQFTLGTTSSITSTITFTVPVAEKTGIVQALAAAAFDTSAGKLFPASASVGAAAGVIHVMTTGGTAGTTGAISNVVPITWATGDYISVAGVYEAN